MRIKITGRENELAALQEKYLSNKSELVVIYGRRRVGKSALIQHFIAKNFIRSGNLAARKNKPVFSLFFEGLEDQRTPAQIRHFTNQLKAQISDPLLQRAEFKDWSQIFEFLTSYISKNSKKMLISFDEFQWMAAGQSKLVALLKYYWDNHWKNSSVMLILCGSIASFMVKKVLHSKALYGRFSLELHVKKLSIKEAQGFFPKNKSHDEILRFILVFGGIPKYLEEINTKRSLEQNIEDLFLKENALFLEEFDKIFNVHFREPKNYLAIIKALSARDLYLEEIAKALKMRSSGGIKAYLENLVLAEFIRPTYSYLHNHNRPGKYKLADEFINFYTHFILPNKRIIKSGGGLNLFRGKILKRLPSWFGFALENYIINNGIYCAERMGFADKVESYGAYFNKKDGVQIDLIYRRTDRTLSVCEIKFRLEPVSTEIIPEFEAKLRKFPVNAGYSIHKILIAPNGASEALRVSEYFDQIVTSQELFS